MKNFPKPLILEDVGDMTFILKEDFIYVIGENNQYVTVLVPKGYKTDLLSVPRLFWNILPPHLGSKAAAVHDYLYSKVVEEDFDRTVADAIFISCLKDAGVPLWRRIILYLGVRFGGWIVIFKKKRMFKKELKKFDKD